MEDAPGTLRLQITDPDDKEALILFKRLETADVSPEERDTIFAWISNRIKTRAAFDFLCDVMERIDASSSVDELANLLIETQIIEPPPWDDWFARLAVGSTIMACALRTLSKVSLCEVAITPLTDA